MGRLLGYPTANLDCPAPMNIDRGVYAARVRYGAGAYEAVLVVGAIPDMTPLSVEVHMFDFNGDLYGEELSVEVLERLSDVEQLSSDEELIEKIEQDVVKAREVFARHRVNQAGK